MKSDILWGGVGHKIQFVKEMDALYNTIITKPVVSCFKVT